jgi:hypothetical protein
VKTALAFTFAFLSLCASAQVRLPRSAEGNALQQLAEITGTEAGDDFGLFVAVSGNTLAVGAPAASDVCENCGAVYVYTAVSGDWTNLVQVAILRQSAGQTVPGGFGYPVAISGNTIVAGGIDSTIGQAAAFVYVNPSGNATQTAELTTTVDNGEEIDSIGIDGGTVVVGSTAALAVPHGDGAAFVYVEPTTGWADMTQTAELVSKDVNTAFGGSVGVSGRNVAVGATEVKIGGIEQGAAYLFLEPAAGWSGIRSPNAEFEASNGTRNAEFGRSASVSGDTVAIGAPDEAASPSQGAVYMFTRPPSGWPKIMTETAELTASHAGGGAELGVSVVLKGSTVVAGAPFAHAGQGLVYVFSEPPGGWQSSAQAEEIAASDGSANNDFGFSVSIGGSVIAAGAFGWPAGGNSADGAAYVFGEDQ